MFSLPEFASHGEPLIVTTWVTQVQVEKMILCSIESGRFHRQKWNVDGRAWIDLVKRPNKYFHTPKKVNFNFFFFFFFTKRILHHFRWTRFELRQGIDHGKLCSFLCLVMAGQRIIQKNHLSRHSTWPFWTNLGKVFFQTLFFAN